MPPRSSLTVPTLSSLPSSLRLPSSHPSVSRPLSKLSRPSLVSLVQEWLRARNQAICGPFLGEEDANNESIYAPAQTLDELRETYQELGVRKGGKREVVDRILEGDWRHGLSLRQLAMVDVQHLIDHPTSLRWTALKLTGVAGSAEKGGNETSTPSLEDELPHLHGPAFLANLQKEIGPLMKTHYHLAHLATAPITILRIYLHDSPYNNQHSLGHHQHASEMSRSILVAFPDNSPFVYTSQSGSTAGHWKHLRKLVIDAIPKALSRPKKRWLLKATSLTARSLAALVASRGGEKTNAAGAGWSIFAKGTVEQSPLRPSASADDDGDGENGENGDAEADLVTTREKPQHVRKRSSEGIGTGGLANRATTKRRKLLAERRFGDSGVADDGRGLDRFEARLRDAFPSQSRSTNITRESSAATRAPPKSQKGRPSRSAIVEDSDDEAHDSDNDKAWRPQVEVTFHGSHIFAGIRQLVEIGAVDGDKMPGWLTGEESVSVGTVRNGRISGHKGAGV
ncbi:MAG: hypothetical protein MMC23_006465 [Stictis urceolatum]|nr:hypothetical protein [Stictis urceolata]